MVVASLLGLGLALPTGALFGIGYGTAIRVGYEIIYPLLFGDNKTPKSVDETFSKMSIFYTAFGGKEANAFGITQGVKNALKAIDADPELVELIKKNSALASQNITVNLSGSGLIDEAGRVHSLPPQSDLSERDKIAIQHEIDKKRFAEGDAVCSSKFGKGYIVSEDFKWCLLNGGSFRKYPSTESAIDTAIKIRDIAKKSAKTKAWQRFFDAKAEFTPQMILWFKRYKKDVEAQNILRVKWRQSPNSSFLRNKMTAIRNRLNKTRSVISKRWSFAIYAKWLSIQ